MIRRVLLVVVLTFLGNTLWANAAPGLKETKDDQNDLKKLGGDWKVESWVQLGRPISISGTWNFKEDKYTLDQGGNVEEGTIKLERGKKPATIDLAITGGTCKGKAQHGIYKLDGDTLTFCLAWPEATDRPSDFESTVNNHCILIILKRSK